MNPDNKQQHALVTGGAGFIGSHLIEWLLANGRKVTIVDNLSTGRRSNLDAALAAHPDYVDFIEADVESSIPQLDPTHFDEIYHLAAAVGVRLVIERPIHTIRTNILDCMAVLEFARQASVPTLLASTSEVYGKSTKTPFAEDDDVAYGPTIYSRWSYACSKAIDEYLGLAHAEQFNLPIVIARFFNTVGPRQVGRYGMVVPRFVEAALQNQPIEVHGDGLQSRCFCDVRDVVQALPRLLEHESAFGRVFNIGRDQPIEILQLATLVCETLNSESEINLVSYEDALGPGFDDLRHRQPDLSRIQAAIGFTPTIELKQTILDLAEEIQQRLTSETEVKSS